ncbi:MAG: hypothetical protein LUE12_03405 [Ruminococcus sp.]|nr:hypothetical protein [Ruminococcus sp.]
MKYFKKVVILCIVIMTFSTFTFSVGATTLEKSYSVTNTYLNTVQSYSYESDDNTTDVTNLTICKKDGYSMIYSCAEIRNSSGSTYANATGTLNSNVNTGSFLRVTASKNTYYYGWYAYYRSYVRDSNDNNKGTYTITRKIVF